MAPKGRTLASMGSSGWLLAVPGGEAAGFALWGCVVPGDCWVSTVCLWLRRPRLSTISLWGAPPCSLRGKNMLRLMKEKRLPGSPKRPSKRHPVSNHTPRRTSPCLSDPHHHHPHTQAVLKTQLSAACLPRPPIRPPKLGLFQPFHPLPPSGKVKVLSSL